MVATFLLHCLEHRIKYGSPEVGSTTQQFLSTKWPCCSIKFIKSFLFWVILVTYNIGIYICIYIYKVSYIHYFFVILCCNVFSALYSKHFEIWKKIVKLTSRLLKKTVFPLVSLPLAYHWVNQLILLVLMQYKS